MLNYIIRFFLENKLVAWLLLILFVGWGIVTAPFDFGVEQLPRDPVSVDAIPDIGENQQIVFTSWMGRSPQDVEDQISYPLTSSLLGIPGVKSIRSNSMFGFSSIYIIFDDDIDFYWSRSRILEKLNSLPSGLLPEGVQATLGPDATALGQIYWYTLEGRDQEGNPAGGWDPQELRSIQDFYVRYSLSSAEGVSEVASIGGFVKEYQVDVDPEAMRIHDISLEQVMTAISQSNIDIGAQTMEINLAEYFVRGLGYVERIEDIEKTVVKVRDNVPVIMSDIAKVKLGPATRRGVLDKSGAEAVGGVVVARYGANPLEVIQNVKEKIAELEPGLPSKTLKDGTLSKIKVIPFYDRTQLINETIGTLEEALTLEVLITVIVVILMLFNLKSSILVSGSLPVSVLMCFIAMRYFGVDANIVALSGIAIAIGTMVDMGIVMTESMINRFKEAPPGESLFDSIYEASAEVGSAVVTAVATTIISFLPVFTMEAAEGKLFRPLAFTKTFALLASIIVAITILPALAHSLFSFKSRSKILSTLANLLAIVVGVFISMSVSKIPGLVLAAAGLTGLLRNWLIEEKPFKKDWLSWLSNVIYALLTAWLLASVWMPLGVNKSNLSNFLFISCLAGGLIALFYVIIHFYESILRFLLRFKLIFLVLVGFMCYQGWQVFKNTGEEFMPALDEGSFLLMPTSMPHSGMQENIKNLRLLDMSVTSIPEVNMVVGKAGRVNSALDPAPMSMYENVILYKSEYKTDENGHRKRFKFENGDYIRDDQGNLIPDKKGRYFRQWRDEIESPDDIWNEIVAATKIPGVTSAPKLQPIETRLVMLQTGMRAPMGIKVRGPDLRTIESFGIELEGHLKDIEGVKDAAVFADRIVGKPYLLLDIDRNKISRYGLSIGQVQKHIQAAVGGMVMSQTVEGRERYSIRVRYPRELRDDPEALTDIIVNTPAGQEIPLGDLVNIRYEQGAQSIKSEDGFLIGFVLFDKEKEYSEVELVNRAQNHLDQLIDDGELIVPAGISFRFAGNYEQQLRANKRLAIVVPVALALIFLILYFQFKSVVISTMVFTGVFIAFAGGFIMIGLYDTPWFLDFDLFGVNMRTLFQINTINLSVAVWVGFLALFGIATDDGVLVASFLRDSFKRNKPESLDAIRDAVVEGGLRRVRPAMMTTATTLLALLPVLSSTGRGSDIMVPMAIPSFGGMSLQIITMFTVPVLFSLWKECEYKLDRGLLKKSSAMKSSTVIICLFLIPVGMQAQVPEALKQMAFENNSAVKSLDADHKAALQRPAQVNELPDPEAALGLYPLPVETRLGSQVMRLGATQMLPWKGVLKARQDVEEKKADIVYQKIDALKLELSYHIEQAYYNYYRYAQTTGILDENLKIFQSLEKLSLAKVESGNATLADVLRVQLKIKEIEQELAISEEQKQKYLHDLRGIIQSDLKESDLPIVSLEFALLELDKQAMIEDIRNQHPSLKMYDHEKELSQSMMKLSELDSKPDFGVGLDYIMVNKRDDATPVSNGRDIVQLRASVTVPIYSKKYDAKHAEEKLKIEAADYRKENLVFNFIRAIEKAYRDYETARLRYELYKEQKLLTRSASRIIRSEYSGSGQKFDELLQLEKDLLDYDLKILNAIVEGHIAKSNIERFI